MAKVKFLFKLKHYIYSGLREIFVYHHNSLEFRAKMFALIIAANENPQECEYILVHKAGMLIYKDEERVDLLVLTTKEYVQKVHQSNGLNIDGLVEDIQKELKQLPRYAQKIDIDLLHPIVECCIDEDTSSYQLRMLEFLQKIKEDYSEENG
ncbi:hypothetical protein JHD50_00825 [Sulfurimonas sp. MAG313]|nr:hypothetical protein [Sulfurimonas sp. MAG313]MDF1879854.1 hypothetical protein [Sulfurimonas sp. MAG313]